MDGEELAKLYGQINEAADTPHARTAELLQLTERLETLTKDAPAWYAATRAKVEVKAT